ncbi:MAG: ArnT family glycosyltransferase [Bacteroidales bacterium]
MAKKIEKPKTATYTNPVTKVTKSATEPKDLLSTMDGYLDRHLNWLIWVVMGLTLMISLLLFDPRVSLTGDDSFYIIRASDFIHLFTYPSFQGALYPMALSIFVAIFGISLIPLKVFSLLCMLAFIYLFFRALRARIPSTLLLISLLIISINSFVMYYASQTYNEAFYLLIQMVMIMVFFQSFVDRSGDVTFKQDIKRHLVLAISLLAIVLTKNIGYSALFAITGYFLLRGQWKNLLYSIVAFAVVMIVFQGIKYALWHDEGLQITTQGSGLMNKDYYNPQAGKEDLAGFYTRFIENSKLYLSKHFISIIGMKKVAPDMGVSAFITILIYILTVGSLIVTYSKNKYLFFMGLLAGAFLLVTFVILQTRWDQSRLIIPVVPLLLLMLFSLIYYLAIMPKLKILQIAIPVFALVVFFQSLAVTAGAIKANNEVKGMYGGLSPDWRNYLKASEWAATNLSKDAIIACRKPSISFVYGKGRNFFGIMQLPFYSTDVFYQNWAKDESSLMLFDYSDFRGKQISNELYKTLKENMLAMIFIGDTVYFADKLNDSLRNIYLPEIKTSGFNYISSVDDFKTKIGEGKTLKLYYPDSLLDRLQNSGVTHVLTANLRRNSFQKDGMIINTVERYVAFVQEKYPEIFTKVSQVGSDDDEPAIISKIEYEKYGRSIKKK